MIGVGNLVRVDLGAVGARVRSRLHGLPEVAGAYLFGSALDWCRRDSDVDLGLIRRDALDPVGDAWAELGLAEELADALARVDGHPFHVTTLTLRAPFLAFEALHSGRAVHVADQELVDAFIEAVALNYRDEYPMSMAALRDQLVSAAHPGRMAEKAAYVRTEVAFLRTLPVDLDRDRDPAGARAARYSLHTAVTALTDLAYHLCARRLHYAPHNARDAFQRLARAGVMSDALMGEISAMVGFRNLAVHGYEVFDDAQLRVVLRDHLADLEHVLAALEAFAAASAVPEQTPP